MTSGKTISISKSLTIDGSSKEGSSKAILNANNSKIVFEIQGKQNIVFKNMIFEQTIASRGAIYMSSGNLTINECDIRNVEYTANRIIGGLIYAGSNSNVNIFNINVYNVTIKSSPSSTAYYNGAGIYIGAKSNCYIENYTFYNNHIAAISNNVNSANMLLGGGLYIDASTAVIKNYEAYNNTILSSYQSAGGALFVNQHSDVTLINLTNYDNTYDESIKGGAVYFLYESDLYVVNCTIERNKAMKGYGYRDESEGMFVAIGRGKIINCTFTDNYAYRARGTALLLNPKESDDVFVVEGCKFHNNYVESSAIEYSSVRYTSLRGGAILVADNYPGSTLISNCEFINNTNALGGAITPNNHCVIDNCIFINNTAKLTMGGAIYAQGNRYLFSSSDIIINNSYFEENMANTGGAIYAQEDRIELNNCTFKDNHAVKGGAIYVSGQRILLNGLNFTNNYATNDFPTRKGLQNNTVKVIIRNNLTLGGAVYIQGNNAIINNSDFRYNSAILTDESLSGNGGAIYVVGNNLKIEKSQFYDNFAHGGNGSAIYISGAKTNITGTEFYHHDSIRGTVFILGSNASISTSSFKNNTASLGGAGVYVDGNFTLIDNCNFENNNATVHGGAIHSHGDYVKVQNSKFISNNAHPSDKGMDNGLGGAIYTRGDYNDIAYCEFRFNTARNGSAIYNRGKELTVEDCRFHYNQAYSYQLEIKVKPVVSKYTKSNRIEINITHIGGDNIINAIYNDGSCKNIYFYNVTYEHSSTDGGKRNSGLTKVNPVESAEKSNNGELIYQDSREDLQIINVTVAREDYMGLLGATEINGDVIQEFSGRTGLYGNISFTLNGDLKPGTYNVYASHPDDRLYKGIENTTRFEITPQVDLKVTKSSDRDSYFVGDTATYTITLESLGTDAHDVDVREILPDGFEIIDYNTSKGEFGANVWYIELLEEGSTATLTVKVKLHANGTFTNIVNVTSRENDTNHTNNIANKTITVKNYVDLDVTKTSSVESFKVGDTIVWTITVKNNGIVNATGVKATDKLPSGVRYISHNASKGEYDPETGVWNISDLAVNETVTLNITVEALTAGRITNTVIVSSNEDDNNTENNEASTTVEVTEENPDDEIPTDDLEKDEPEIDDGVNPKDNDESISSSISDGHATGNPILLVLVALLSICIASRRKI